MTKPRTNDGQALMIVLLALAAVASVALTVSTRTTTDVSVTANVEESQRAFTAAEAGIEKTLLNSSEALSGTVTQSVGNGGASFSTTANTIPDNPQEYAYPFTVPAGEIATLWFMSHNSSNQLSCNSLPCYTGQSVRICWGEGSPAVSATNAGALEVTVYHENTPGQVTASRVTIDPDSSRRSSNKFSLGTDTGCGDIGSQKYAFTRLVNLSSDMGISNYSTPGVLKMMRVRLLYNNTPQPIGFRTNQAGANLPVQGVRIDSLGSSGSSSRRLEAFSLHPVVPSMFEAALFSPPGVTKSN